MKGLRLVWLGLRLAVAGGRAAWVRLVLMGIGFAVGSSLLLGALSLVPASRTHDYRQYGRYGTLLSAPKDRHAPNTLLAWQTAQRFGNLDIEVWALHPQGDAPVPPGLGRIPAPGQVIASPALAELMRGRDGPALARRFHGTLAGVIGNDGLVSPDELSAYVGKPPNLDITAQPPLVIGSFDYRAGASAPLDLTALLLIAVLASALLLPIWLFVGTATRLSAATRESRLAAVRLAGGTQQQVRFLSGIEAELAAIVGTAIGIPLFLAFRPLLADGVILGNHYFPQDLSPPFLGACVVVIGLPILAVTITLITMRRLIVSPLGIVRRHRKAHAHSVWPFVMLVGIGILAWAASQHAGLIRRGDLEAESIVTVGLILAGLGLGGTAVWLGWILARWGATHAPSTSMLLGMRRLESDPSGAARVIGGVAILIALVGVTQAGLFSETIDGPTTLLAPWADKLDSSTVIAVPFEGGDAAQMADLREVAGVVSLHRTNKLPSGGTRTGATTAIIRTDGNPTTLERLRERVGWIASVDTVAQLRVDYRSEASLDSQRISRLITATTLFLLLVTGATFLVATVDWIMERRRTLAVLSALGVQTGVIRRSLLVQIGLPLATSAVMGVAAALSVIGLLYTAVEARVVYPFSQLGFVTLAVIAIVLMVTLLATPWLQIAGRPELLRSE